ncbi:MAG: hypothetical protein HYR72_05495 [Deltaproteobacteria bacterium]|nr:hypothetical protein [Deltaproteobacteria bacterium]MBI3389656.1 hypothetical protein [Deltaproteobacteria bacterium]
MPNVEIAQLASLRPITEIAASLEVTPADFTFRYTTGESATLVKGEERTESAYDTSGSAKFALPNDENTKASGT